MYHVTLVNLTADARTVDILAEIEKRDVPEEELRGLLQNFTGLDPVANAGVDAEVRVRVRGGSYRLRTEQKKLVLYDVLERDLPGQVMTVDEALAELNGTAAAARTEVVVQARAEAAAEPAPAEETYVSPLQPFDYGNDKTVLPVAAPPVIPPNPRLTAALAVTAAVLLAAEAYLEWPRADERVPAGFAPVAAEDAPALAAALTGVYVTGSEPGAHGIVLGGPAELKFFELGTVAAPRTVNAVYRLGQVEGKLWLATDQPGGGIAAVGDGSLRYCGETYRRIP